MEPTGPGWGTPTPGPTPTPPPPPGWGPTPPPGWGTPPRTTPLTAFDQPEPVKPKKPVMVVVGVILILAAISAVIIGIVLVVNAAQITDDKALVDGRIGGPTVAFEQAADGRVTVYLRSSSSNTDVIDSQVAATTCLVQDVDSTSQIRGSRQGFSVTLGSTATIGYVDVQAGEVLVQCTGSFSSGLRFTVSAGGPPNVIVAFVFLFGGVALFLGGLALVIVGAIRRSRRRRRQANAAYGF